MNPLDPQTDRESTAEAIRGLHSYPVSVVVPTFNRAALIPRALDSVLNQTVRPEQIIVVDDGSTDDTQEVCRRYSDRVDYVRQTNSGASAARNHGIELARNPWIAFLDSDDYWTGSHLERLISALALTAGKADMYFSDMLLPKEESDQTLWQQLGFEPQGPFQLVDDASDWVLMGRQPMMLQTSLIRKMALDVVGRLDIRYRLAHDTDLFCKIGLRGPACAVAGIGCIQTADDATTARLTTAVPLRSIAKASEDFLIWSDLRRSPLVVIPPRFAALVRYRVARNCWSVGRYLGWSGRYGAAAIKLMQALIIEPRLILWLVREHSLEGYEDHVRPASSVFSRVPREQVGIAEHRGHVDGEIA